jgi:hypothetical protein
MILAFFSGRSFSLGLSCFSVSLFLWFRLFRHEHEPARVFAGIMGAYILLMIIFVNLIVANLNEREIPVVVVWLYVYAGMGHLAYAFFGRQRHY